MSRLRAALVFVAVAGIALAAGYFVSERFGTGGPARTQQGDPAAAIFAAVLPDLSGTPRAIEQWEGRILLVNFWATWCEPCREEIPALMRVQRRLQDRGLQIVGIAIDSQDKVVPYAADLQINYPILIGDLGTIELTRQAGNQAGGLPYTLVFDRTGRLRVSHLGGLTDEKLEQLLTPFL